MIPIRDVIPTPTRPWATLSIITLTLALFVAGRLESGWLVTGLFGHSGLLHVASNMAALWLFGSTVEDRLGRLRFLFLYLGTGGAALLIALAVHPLARPELIGSGGAVAGIAGAYFYLFPKSQVLVLVPLGWVLDLIEVPAVFLLVFWFLVAAAGATVGIEAAAGGLAALAHAVGLLIGLSLAPALRRPERLRVEWWDGVIRRSGGVPHATQSPAR